ncbi:hypothetical protein [Hyphomicrobium zavarzinii]|uniref:hypothetical protein n=1 Tax=Hyphomicrobium zavarzinii TaxID=48292 RepID=UPI00035D675F|nr:hypothetical protein [Hyphomicrobium zavarzinii]
MIRTATLALAALIAIPAVASAHTIDQRRDWQAEKIEQGRKDGSITWREGIKLRKEQRDIARTESTFKEKGYLTKTERRTLTQMQNKAAHNIRAEKNDSWRRWWLLPRVGR